MKRILKRGLSLLVVLLLVLSLTGCQALDDMKAAQAFWLTNGNILYGDVEYRLLPECDVLNPLAGEETPYVYVTEQEVPVLLSEVYGDSFAVSLDRSILFKDSRNGACYCAQNRYDEMIDKISSGDFFDTYAYVYYDYDAMMTLTYLLTESERSAVDWVFYSETPEILPDYVDIPYDYVVELLSCSEDMLFSDYCCDLYVNGDQYYLCVISGDTSAIYTVPDSMQSVFEGMLKSYMNAEEYWLE